MTVQHQSLAAGRWKEMTFLEQMANIGSEVDRALELLDLSLESTQGFSRLKSSPVLAKPWLITSMETMSISQLKAYGVSIFCISRSLPEKITRKIRLPNCRNNYSNCRTPVSM